MKKNDANDATFSVVRWIMSDPDRQLEDLLEATKMIYLLCVRANDGAFENGVIDDNSSWIDQGDFSAVQIMEDAKFALEQFGVNVNE